MELHFKETSVQTFQDVAHLNKAVQLSMESVVPDTRDDIGRILSVNPEVYLKSKEIGSKSAVVTGEALVTVLYINEEQNGVSSFSISQSFCQEYDLPSVLDSDILQLHFSVNGIQARIINPRKLSVDMEINLDLTVSSRVSAVVTQELPETNQVPVHLQQAEIKTVMITGIREKNISINEQIPFPEEAAPPKEIICKVLNYVIREKETVSSRLLLKGDALMDLHYYPIESPLPCSCHFSIPFSQLIDLGDEQADSAEVWLEPTSEYVSLIEGLDGRKLLDAELHALIQCRAERNQDLQLITDAYCNQMHCECNAVEQTVCESVNNTVVQLAADERIDLPEEFLELLSVFPSLGSCTAEKGSASVDLLCRANDGSLFSIRRNLTLRAEDFSEGLTVKSFRLTDVQVSQENRQLMIRIVAEAAGRKEKTDNIHSVNSLNLNEDQPVDLSEFPSITAVWAKTESIWEMAKHYHSSTDAICAMNQDLSLRPIYVPKTK